MKTFTRLVEEVTFEAGAVGFDNLESVAGIIIEEVLDKHTSQIKYPELLMPDATLTVSNLATGRISLPTDYQHIDWDTFRILPEGVVGNQYSLRTYGNKTRGVNEGVARYYSHDATYIYVFPYISLANTDVFMVSYWRKSNAKTNNLIVPDSLVQTVKDEAAARLANVIGSKTAGSFIQLSRDSHAASLGAVDLPSANS